MNHPLVHHYYVDSSKSYSLIADYTSQVNYDLYILEDTITFKEKTIEDAYSALEKEYDIKIHYTSPMNALVYLYVKGSKDCVGVINFHSQEKFTYRTVNDIPGEETSAAIYSSYVGTFVRTKVRNFTCKVTYYGQFDHVKIVYNLVSKEIGFHKIPTIFWYFSSDGGTQVEEISLNYENEIHDEYYPYIEGGIDKFIDDYLASSESVLLLMGPPGTGKSSFLRYMINKHSLTATLTYDEYLLEKDTIFVNHITNSRSDILVLEDADVLLESRKTSQNKLMHKLLNVSDGIIKVNQKKMIFTTNLESTRDIDPALLRPGRCFAVVHFRELTCKEANAAAKAAGMPEFADKNSHVLADVFNKERNREVITRKIGF